MRDFAKLARKLFGSRLRNTHSTAVLFCQVLLYVFHQNQPHPLLDSSFQITFVNRNNNASSSDSAFL